MDRGEAADLFDQHLASYYFQEPRRYPNEAALGGSANPSAGGRVARGPAGARCWTHNHEATQMVAD